MSSDEQTTEAPQTPDRADSLRESGSHSEPAMRTPDRRPEVANEPPPVMRISRESMEVARNLLELKQPEGHFLDVAAESLRAAYRDSDNQRVIYFCFGLILALVWPAMARTFVACSLLWPVAFLWSNHTSLHWKYSFTMEDRVDNAIVWTLVWLCEISAVGIAFSLIH